MPIPEPADPRDRDADLASLHQTLAALRLCEAAALAAVRASLERHGQLTAVLVFEHRERLEVIDGFKRVEAARALGWPTLRVRVLPVDLVAATVLIAVQAGGRGLTELEEGWLVRALHREHGLYQSAIAERLGHHPAWVCRRLLLVERIDAAVAADVRLGLLSARAAVEIAQLPRGNQAEAATMAVRRGLTVRQLALVVDELLELSGDAARKARIEELTGGAKPTRRTRKGRPPKGSEADAMAADIRTLRNVAARLQARLLEHKLVTLGPDVAGVLGLSLAALLPILTALSDTIATTEERAA